MKTAETFLKEALNCKIEYAGEGKIYTTWNGKDVRQKKYKYIIHFGNSRWISKHPISFVIQGLKNNIIKREEIENYGGKICPRCNGTGIHETNRHYDGGWCFKCGGDGIFWKSLKT